MISLLSNHSQTNKLDVPLKVATPVEWWRQYALPTHSHHSPAHTSRFMVHTLATGSLQRGLAFHSLDAPMVSVGIDFCFYVLFDVTRRARLVFVHDSSLFFTHYLQSLYKLKSGNYFFSSMSLMKIVKLYRNRSQFMSDFTGNATMLISY